MRPHLRQRGQPRPHRIHKNVIRFFIHRFVASKPVLEKVPLPSEPADMRRPALKVRNDFPHRMCRVGEAEQGMDMVGHDHKDPAKPNAFRVPMPNRIEDRCAMGGKKIGTPLFRTDREKEKRLLGRNSNRCFVWQDLASDFHVCPDTISRRVRRPRPTGSDGSPGRPTFTSGCLPGHIGYPLGHVRKKSRGFEFPM